MRLIALPTPDDPRIFAAALNRGECVLPESPNSDWSLNDLAENSDAVLVFDEPNRRDIAASLASLWQETPADETVFIPLVPNRPLPRVDPAYCPPISSFFCSAAVMRRFVALGLNQWARTLCFEALRAVVDGAIEVDRLLVRETPLLSTDPLRQPPPHALVLPHRGPAHYLRAALTFLGKCAGRSTQVRVGLDVDDPSEYTDCVEKFPGVEFYRFDPAPVGPYVIRQELAEQSPEPYLTLQDSDDLSCYDRFSVLSGALSDTAAGIVGSHELCLDEIRGLVQPVRFPLDSTAALEICPNHALLHATLMTSRETFFRVGGLSTDRIIANDTQFLLRAFFTTPIRNVDRFLYIRRRHADSLTNAPETIYDNPLRRRLNSEWTGDFNAIKRAEKTLEQSSLWPVRRTEPWRTERLGIGKTSVTV